MLKKSQHTFALLVQAHGTDRDGAPGHLPGPRSKRRGRRAAALGYPQPQRQAAPRAGLGSPRPARPSHRAPGTPCHACHPLDRLFLTLPCPGRCSKRWHGLGAARKDYMLGWALWLQPALPMQHLQHPQQGIFQGARGLPARPSSWSCFYKPS